VHSNYSKTVETIAKKFISKFLKIHHIFNTSYQNYCLGKNVIITQESFMSSLMNEVSDNLDSSEKSLQVMRPALSCKTPDVSDSSVHGNCNKS
jgi:hypothetical protein